MERDLRQLEESQQQDRRRIDDILGMPLTIAPYRDVDGGAGIAFEIRF
jgi:hypothetical protein